MLATSRLWVFRGLLTGLILLPFAPASAQTFNVIHNVNCTTDGCQDQQAVPMTQGRDGNMYGRMTFGGLNNFGTIWNVTPTGTLTDIYNSTVNQTAGSGLTIGTDGNFYGANVTGGANNMGFVFKVTTAGTFTTLFSFTSKEGGFTGEALTQGSDGNLYGIVDNNCYFYKITVSTGAYTDVSNTCPPNNVFYGLTLGANGTLYGTTVNGGASGQGTFYSMSTGGKVTTIHSFNAAVDVENPVGIITQASDGNFYGATADTPTNSFAGQIFKITTAGKVTVLHTFASDGSDGTNITAGLLAASDGNLYGVTQNGGANNAGVIYKITTSGTFTKIRDLDCATDGCNNWAPLGQRTDGTLYGVSVQGGSLNGGTIYTLSSSSFTRFVTVPQYSAASGKTVDILGNGLTGATAVNFGSIPATSFKVSSDNFMTAVVSPDAITANVSVTTPTGTVSTLKNLKVPPTVTSFSPTSGPVGTAVTINGTGFTGATKVTFGGVKASPFTIVSATEITTTVPTGAVTGAIAVTTAGGTGSRGTFTVN